MVDTSLVFVQDKRMRREENLRRRQENERKAEIVQVVSLFGGKLRLHNTFVA